MGYRDNRIVWSDNGTLVDLSQKLADYFAQTQVIPLVAAQDYVYIGSIFPFNHRWIKVKTVNALASSISVHIWDGTYWKACADLVDETKVSTATLAQSGIISWIPEKREVWMKEDTNYQSETVDGLTGISIYDMYWARLTFSGDLTAGTELQYVGHKFSDDNLLGAYYPDLDNSTARQAFNQGAAGKTDWEEQLVQASEALINDLKARSIIKSGNQILRWETFSLANTHKTAELIYNAFGDDYSDNREQAKRMYERELAVAIKQIDLNNNARLDLVEQIRDSQGWLNR